MFNKILAKYADNEKGQPFTGYSTDTVTSILQVLGNPHKSIRTVHIAGTNGKGTTAAALSSILSHAGYRTGLFTSPHLIRINERIKIDGRSISDSDLDGYAEIVESAAESLDKSSPTYFDFLTAMAFLYFRDMQADIAVIETGLGGRLDSTNIIIPELSLITAISIDHTEMLGSTIEEISREKCGIIKDGVPVITANCCGSSLKTISDHAAFHNSELIILDRDFFTSDLKISGRNLEFLYGFPESGIDDLKICIPLQPLHQAANISLAVTAALFLRNRSFSKINMPQIIRTLEELHLEGRFEILADNPFVIFDPAHNIDALKSLVLTAEAVSGNRKIQIFLSMMSDKLTDQVKEFIDINRDRICYYNLSDKRAYRAVSGEFRHIFDSEEELAGYMQKEPDSCIFLFTGTFRLYETALRVSGTLEATK